MQWCSSPDSMTALNKIKIVPLMASAQTPPARNEHLTIEALSVTTEDGAHMIISDILPAHSKHPHHQQCSNTCHRFKALGFWGLPQAQASQPYLRRCCWTFGRHAARQSSHAGIPLALWCMKGACNVIKVGPGELKSNQYPGLPSHAQTGELMAVVPFDSPLRGHSLWDFASPTCGSARRRTDDSLVKGRKGGGGPGGGALA